MLDLEEEDQCCLLTDLMDEAEDAWKTVLKRQTIASLSDEIQADRFQEQVTALQELIREKNGFIKETGIQLERSVKNDKRIRSY